MRGLLALVFALLVAVNTVNSGAIYRRYRQLELPLSGQSDAAQLLPAENYVSELRKNQIPVQVVEVVEPVLVVKPVENLRSVEPVVTLAEAEPAAVISNEIIPEKLEKLQENLETVRAIEQAVIAQEQELQQPIAETVVAIAEQAQEQEQGQQQLRNIEPEAPAAPAILLVEEAVLPQKQEEPLAALLEIAEKKLPEPILPAALPEKLPEAIPEELPAVLPKLPEALPVILEKQPLAPFIKDEKLEEAKPLADELPALKAIKEEEPAKEIIPEASAAQEIALPAAIEKQTDLKSLEEQAAPAEEQPQLKVLKEEAPLIETPKLEELLPERKEELLEKKEEIKEEKKEILKEAIEEAIKEEIKEVLKEKSQPEIPLDSKDLEAPISGRQADTADPAPTTARPAQPGFIQQLVQNTPLGQLLNNFNGANNQAAPEQNTPVATAATFIQALQNTTSQITNSIQQGFQQQLQSLQTTFTGQQPQQAVVASDAAAPAATPRPQGPFQSIVTSFLGGNGQAQQQAAPAPAQQGGPLQGILNLFGGNRVPASASAPATSAPAALPVKVEAVPAEVAAPAAAEEISPESARDSVESADDSLEAVKPDEIVVNDDDTHE
ncbi:20-hydroxyecdysone protein [Episyrphus balteatus]|uniref:20-hydroxyecdysone protein n=1 Tax=Episyrphus balteatus TaxID=286459 RepID=UPI002486BD16|nr:20-hydroxyecdysone protein [Episyrphus balteatus]